MSRKAKVWIGYSALVALSALLLLVCLHYRSKYRHLARLVSQRGTAFDLARAGAAMNNGEVLAQVVRPALHFGVRSWFYGLDPNVGVELPSTCLEDLRPHLEHALVTAATAATFGEDVAQALDGAGPSDEQIGKMLEGWPRWLSRREGPTSVGEAMKRQYRYPGYQAPPLTRLVQAGVVLVDSGVGQKIIRPAVYQAVKSQFAAMETDLGPSVVWLYQRHLESDIVGAIPSAAYTAGEGLEPARTWFGGPDPRSHLDEIRKQRDTPTQRNALRSIYQHLKRRFEQKGDEARTSAEGLSRGPIMDLDREEGRR